MRDLIWHFREPIMRLITIADDRGSQIAESSAIVCDHMETHFCDPAIVIADDRRR